MLRCLRWTSLLLCLAATGRAQEKRSHIDVQKYSIEADINPHTQSIVATAKIFFTPLEDTNSATFELNNALTISKTVDGNGSSLPTSRSSQDSSFAITFPGVLPKSKPAQISISYTGKLTGDEESPVFGIKFAALHPDFGYLLYPSRWFPVNGYTVDRFSADFKITTPAEYRVIGSGDMKTDRAGSDKAVYFFSYTQSGFPGSLAIVKEEPVKVSSQGIATQVFFRGDKKDFSQAYGEEAGKMLTYFTTQYGLAPQASLSVIETESGAANGYYAPGLVFLSPGSIAKQVNLRVLSNQISRQWFGVLISPSSRNQLWLTNGPARFSELLYIEHVGGPGAMEADLKATYIEALTVTDPPVLQAGRLEDYSPEYWAVTAAKGAAVLNMLRGVIGDADFKKGMMAFLDKFAYKPVNTEDFRKTMEQASGQDLRYFFLQWLESSGSPEFKLEYTVFRTAQGFRITGKITQDMDTFRMPVDVRIETEGNPEDKKIEVTGTSSEFSIDTFGKPRKVILDPQHRLLRLDNSSQVAVAIRKGEEFFEMNDFAGALREYQKALDVARNSSLAHYRIGELFFKQNNFQSAANEFRAALNGDLDPRWTEVWSHIYLGEIFDVSGQRDRAVNEYKLAIRTHDNTGGAQEQAAKYSTKPYERPSSDMEAH